MAALNNREETADILSECGLTVVLTVSTYQIFKDNCPYIFVALLAGLCVHSHLFKYAIVAKV